MAMYAEEYLPDDAVLDDISINDISVSDTITVDSLQMKTKKMVELHKLSDPDYYKWYSLTETAVKVENTDEETIVKKVERIEGYATPVLSNAVIRSATTGIYTDDRSGTYAEDYYFVVNDTTGSHRLKMNARNRNMFNTEEAYMRYLRQFPETKKLYYKNPEEFERHQHVILPQSMKEAWYEKNLARRSRV